MPGRDMIGSAKSAFSIAELPLSRGGRACHLAAAAADKARSLHASRTPNPTFLPCFPFNLSIISTLAPLRFKAQYHATAPSTFPLYLRPARDNPRVEDLSPDSTCGKRDDAIKITTSPLTCLGGRGIETLHTTFKITDALFVFRGGADFKEGVEES